MFVHLYCRNNRNKKSDTYIVSGDKATDELTGKFNISGAGLKEAKIKNQNDEDEEEDEEEEEIKKETVKFSETKKDKDEDEEFEVDFNNSEEVEKFTGAKTKDSQNIKEKHFEGETIADIQREISEAEKKANDIDPETFYDVADFIITLVDGSIASGLKWWTKDSSDSAYSLTQPKKNKLTKQLAKILIKYNAKFSIELMFIVGLIIMYIPAFRVARARKKEIAEIQAKHDLTQIPKVIVRKQEVANPIIEEIDNLEKEEIEVKPKKEHIIVPAKPIRKRKIGKPLKS